MNASAKHDGPPVTRSLFLGMTGYGKTWRAMETARQHPRVIVVDAIADPPGKGWSTHFGVVTTARQLVECVQRPTFQLAVQFDEDPLETLRLVVEIVRSVDERGNDAVPNTLVVLEEASILFEGCDARLKSEPDIRHWIILGRRQGSSWLLISQRYVDIPVPFRAQATDLFIFGTREDIDLKRHHSDISYVDMLRKMPKYFYCHVDRNRGTPPSLMGPDGRVVRRIPEDRDDPVRREVADRCRHREADPERSPAPGDRGGVTGDEQPVGEEGGHHRRVSRDR